MLNVKTVDGRHLCSSLLNHCLLSPVGSAVAVLAGKESKQNPPAESFDGSFLFTLRDDLAGQ